MRAVLTTATLMLLVACRSQPTPSPHPEAAAGPSVSDAVPEEAPEPAVPETTAEHADRLAHTFIILDGHIDVPWRLEKSKAEDGSVSEDVSARTVHGDFDYARARAGGLDAPFMSIYVSPKFENKGAKKVADGLIDMVEAIAAGSPDKFVIARSVAEVEASFAAGKISLPLGMENGAPIERDLANVRHFYERGIRYITLAHSEDNHISDSSYDKRHTHGGLSKFGRKVVAEMNRVGIMIDVSHLSDDAFWDVLDVSATPVIASHSSCRHFTPGWERNMSDDMIRALADKGGVIQINFGSGFLDHEVRKARDERRAKIGKMLKRSGIERKDHRADALVEAYESEHPAPVATVETVADHIDHVVKLVGAEHVGLGSDFDGVGDSVPKDLEDVSKYPNLIRVLLERGYSEADIEKICSKNAFRVWRAVETHAAGASERRPPTR